jgi:NADH-quinone oxidoreductase subunit A
MSMVENALVVLLLIGVSLIIDGILVLLIKIVPMKRHSQLKVERYESGNIPTIPPKRTLSMQYFGYVFMFMACEPILVLLLLFAVSPNGLTIPLVMLAFILLAPALYVSYRYTLDLAYKARW